MQTRLHNRRPSRRHCFANGHERAKKSRINKEILGLDSVTIELEPINENIETTCIPRVTYQSDESKRSYRQILRWLFDRGIWNVLKAADDRHCWQLENYGHGSLVPRRESARWRASRRSTRRNHYFIHAFVIRVMKQPLKSHWFLIVANLQSRNFSFEVNRIRDRNYTLLLVRIKSSRNLQFLRTVVNRTRNEVC